MGYILQNTSGLISTRITDVGRRKISQGNLNIQYFQIGDSEVSYTGVTNSVSTTSKVLMPPYNAQNNTGYPQSTKNDIKYPYYMEGSEGNTYGIPYMESEYVSIYNSAEPRGFFSGDSSCWYVQPCSAYTINSEFDSDTSLFDGGLLLSGISNPLACDSSANGTINLGDYVTIFYNQSDLCSCYQSCYQTLTYKVTYYDSGTNLIGFDRPIIDFSSISTIGNSRLMVYPSGMTSLYDTITPAGHWNDDVINYESLCYTDQISSLIWNMNIIWSQSIAGLNNATYQDYNYYTSKDYIGTKEYLGYMSSSGQSASTDVYYFNSYGDKIIVSPEEQKAISVIHFTNQSINNFYGEKFAVEEYDPNDPGGTGQARNFKVHIPTLMWHKNLTSCCSGETFYVDPPVNGGGFMEQGLLVSSKNSDMNNPGIRYYTLWDNNLSTINGEPNRVGKVFPDDHLIVFDDAEIVSALSYKSNRNWTLPAPKVTLTPPNICSGDITSEGLLSGETETLWVSYGFYNNGTFTNSLHCSYYQQIQGPTSGCTNYSMDVSLIFGSEFGCMNVNGVTGFVAEEFYVIAQKVTTGEMPNPNLWKEIDFTNNLSGYTAGGYILPEGLTATTFTITSTLYDSASIHDMGSVLYLPTIGSDGELNFGDEYYFYGNIETDIQATIYEMKYRINLPSGMFMNSSNPSWNNSLTPHFTEIGLYDSNKDLIFISKMQRPTQRSGIQQIMIKYDF